MHFKEYSYKLPHKNCAKMQTFFKVEMEFPIQVSPQLLFQYIATPSGLSKWFAQNVTECNKIFTFFWEDTQEKAKLIRIKFDRCVKFRWENKPCETYFEMKILFDELTKDVELLVVDFAESEAEINDVKQLWENQIADLKHALGVL